jgi:hypothetical protein
VLTAIVVTILVWASAFLVIRGTAEHFSGGALALARLVVGSAALGLLMIGRPWVRPTARQWVGLALYGVAWFGAYNVALNIAEQTLDRSSSPSGPGSFSGRVSQDGSQSARVSHSRVLYLLASAVRWRRESTDGVSTAPEFSGASSPR